MAGSACRLTTVVSHQVGDSAATAVANDDVLGKVNCVYNSAEHPPSRRVNTSAPQVTASTGFSTGFAYLNSPVYSIVLPSAQACQAQAAKKQACGYCELQSKSRIFSKFSIEKAERMENCP